MVAYAHRFTRHAFVLSPLSESPQHLSQNFSSSFFKEEGFLPAKEAPGTSFSVRIMLLSADEELDDAMISLLLISPRPFQPRFHALESKPFRAAAIYEYGVYQKPKLDVSVRLLFGLQPPCCATPSSLCVRAHEQYR